MLKAQHRVYLSAFLIDFGVMAGTTALPFFVFDQLRGGAAMSGAFGAAASVVYAASSLLSAGVVSRAKNGLTWAVWGLVLSGLFTCMTPAFRSPWVCGVLWTVGMAALALVWPALHSWVGAEPDLERRGRRMARFNLSWSFGFALSPLLAGPLYDLDYRLPFALLFVMFVAVLTLLRFVPHEKDHFGEATPEMLSARAEEDRASESSLYAAWMATVAGNALGSVTRTVFPKRIGELVAAGQLRWWAEDAPAALLTSNPATKYSWLAFVLSLVTALTFIWMGRSRRWRHQFQLILWLEVAAGAAFYVLGSTRSLVVMVLCFVVVGAFHAVSFFSAVYYSMVDPARKHARAAINEGAVGAGGFLGSMVFGYLAGHYGLAVPFRLTPVFVLGAIAVQLALLYYGHRRQRRLDAAARPPYPAAG